MSYDVYLHPPEEKCERCGREYECIDCPDPTYNLTPIFDLALTGEPLPNPSVSESAVVLLGAETDRPRGLRVLDGRVARDTIAELDNALERLSDPSREAEFLALEPQNRWGDLAGARSVVEKLRDLARTYTSHKWEVR